MILLILSLFGVTVVSSYPGLIGDNSEKHGDFRNLGIVNGVKSKKMLPYLCQILENEDHICGCSILDNNTVLTAAHCYDQKLKPSKYKIGVGNLNLGDQEYYKVKTFTIHENYNKGVEFDNDVAIIKLKTFIKMIDGKVAPIKIFESCNEKLPYGQLALAAGWGAFDEDLKEFPDELYETKLKVLKNTDPGCIDYYETEQLTDRMFCAGWANGKSDVCGGDSGGPLVNKYNEQIGLVSWAIGCSRVNRSTVFTDVCQMKNWITEKWDQQ